MWKKLSIIGHFLTAIFLVFHFAVGVEAEVVHSQMELKSKQQPKPTDFHFFLFPLQRIFVDLPSQRHWPEKETIRF